MISKKPNTYGWIPWVFVGAMALVVAVNGVLVYFAVREPVGIIVKNPYQDGLRYNSRLEERERQKALGWQVAAGMSGKSAPSATEIRVEAQDDAGRALDGLKGRVRFDRPVERLPAIEAELIQIGPGAYVASVVLPRPGQWEMTVDLDNGRDSHSASRRVQIE